MTDINFRVWDKISKTMHYPGDGSSYCVTATGAVCLDFTDDGGILENQSHRAIAMLFAGMKDKNGVKAYEQDIVKAKLTSKSSGYLGEFVGVIEFQEFELCLSMNDESFPSASWLLVDGFEIIGNTHENPELLERSK